MKPHNDYMAAISGRETSISEELMKLLKKKPVYMKKKNGLVLQAFEAVTQSNFYFSEIKREG